MTNNLFFESYYVSFSRFLWNDPTVSSVIMKMSQKVPLDSVQTTVIACCQRYEGYYWKRRNFRFFDFFFHQFVIASIIVVALPMYDNQSLLVAPLRAITCIHTYLFEHLLSFLKRLIMTFSESSKPSFFENLTEPNVRLKFIVVFYFASQYCKYSWLWPTYWALKRKKGTTTQNKKIALGHEKGDFALQCSQCRASNQNTACFHDFRIHVKISPLFGFRVVL